MISILIAAEGEPMHLHNHCVSSFVRTWSDSEITHNS